DNDATAVMVAVNQLAQMSPDYDNALSEILSLLHQIALLKQVPDALDQQVLDYQQIKDLSAIVSTEDVQLFYQIGLIGRRDLALAPDMKSGFEMVLLRMLAFKPVQSNNISTTAAASKPIQRPVANNPAMSKAPQQTPVSAAPATTFVSPSDEKSQPGHAGDDAISSPTMNIDNISDLNAEWHGIVNALPVRGMARQLALNCELKGYEDKFIILNVSPEHKSMLTKSVEDQLTTALSQFFKKDLKLKIETGDMKNVTPAVVEQKKVEDKQQSAQQSIESDSVVQALKDNFGATVVEQSVRPIED
ncbi:MAG: hypothetical protein KAU21_07150, partial [Gammaproteobacteria bacterium]|nr:hypothetical protein [Gammaproteobacteria bacterium]